jgi:hypothetical protein
MEVTIAPERGWFMNEMWQELSPWQRHVEEKVGKACFCDFIAYSEHIPTSRPLDGAGGSAGAGAGIVSKSVRVPGRPAAGATASLAEAKARGLDARTDAETAAALAAERAETTCAPTDATAYIMQSAQHIRQILKVVAPYTEVVTVARSDDYFLPPQLTPETEWLVLSALHEAGLGIAKVAVPPSRARNSTDDKVPAKGAEMQFELKQYLQMEQLLSLTTPPPGLCTRAAPFCVDWARPATDMCWKSEFRNDMKFHF